MFLKSKFVALLFIVTLFSCQEKTNKIAVKSNEKIKVDSIYTMQPFNGSLPDLKKLEKDKIYNSINNFYEEKFVSNDFSGSIIVAKNGHIIFEKYSGMSNFKEKKWQQIKNY